MSERIVFVASIPDIQSAISLSGEGSSRVKIDVSESEVAEVVKLLAYRGQSFKVTIEPL